MAYTTIDKPTDYFNTKLYTGNGSTQSITGVGFQPDFVWGKDRDGTDNHHLFDVIRGTNQRLISNQTSAENTEVNCLNSFDSDGFTLGSNTGLNNNGDAHVSWNWKAGGTASSNTDGSITSSVSANTTAGFSIVSYTGTGSNATVGHGLGSKPNVMFQKKRSGDASWVVYHDKVDVNPSHKYLTLNQSSAVDDYAQHFNDTEPTSSVFTVGTDSATNGSGATNIVYCFAEKKGYSKFGSYTGNGSSDGSYIHLEFKPAVIIAKLSSGVSDWRIYDNKRLGYNVDNNPIRINDNRAEETDDNIDFLSNGFKWRTTDGALNGSGSTYIYMAFAENPFVTSTGIPTTAR